MTDKPTAAAAARVASTRARAAAGASLTALLAAVLVAASAGPASATAWPVDSEASLISALTDASADSSGGHTISINGDFTMTGAVLPTYVGTESLTIEGNGHTITYVDTPGAMWIDSDGAVLIQDLALTGATTAEAGVTVVAVGDIELARVTVSAHAGPGAATKLISDTGEVIISESSFNDAFNSGGPGGAVTATGVAVTLFDVTFTDNSSAFEGGALYADAPFLGILGATFDNNFSAEIGGAIYATGGTEMGFVSFDQNTSAHGGGAFYAADYVDLGFASFTRNTSAGDGGAVLTDRDFYAEQSTFDHNESEGNGGAVWAWVFADSYMSTFSANSAEGVGGAIYSEGSDYSIHDDSTFTGNSAEAGGAFFGANDDLEATHVTFADNEAAGGAAHVLTDLGEIHAYGSSFSGAVGAQGCLAGGAIVSSGFNVDQDGTCAEEGSEPGDGGLGLDPQLGALADNGGFTDTRMPALTSPLVDWIDEESCLSAADGSDAVTYDQRGVDRVSAVLSQGGGCDAGAVEVPKDITFAFAGPRGTVTFTVSGAFDTDDSCEAATSVASAGGTPPAGVSFPHGLFSFCAITEVPGAPVTVVVDFPSPVTTAWKVQGGVWQQIPGATFTLGGTRLTYADRDGGTLDADGSEDGYFTDPLGAGIFAVFAG